LQKKLEELKVTWYNKVMEKNTIVAIATPYGNGGVGIIRLSGPQSLELAKKMFEVPSNFQARTMYLGKIHAENFEDTGFFVYFKAPHSYTGEDVVEFQVHGGMIILQKIMEKIISLGAKLASRGEFTKRAFFNSKISLNEAESIIELINATSEASVCVSERLLSGGYSEKIKKLQNSLTELIAEVEVFLDYPEIDEDEKTDLQFKIKIEKIKNEIFKLMTSYKQGQLIKNGVNVCIVGRPNVGKSSLLNSILGKDTAIVTEIEGTTTDIISDYYIYNTIKFNIVDTAGIREGKNIIEKIGIEKSLKNLELADIVLIVLDLSSPFTDLDHNIIELSKGKKRIFVLNKIDISKYKTQYSEIYLHENYIETCAKESFNIEKLKAKIFDMTISAPIDDDYIVVTNERHYIELNESYISIERALNNIMSDTLDCICVDLQASWYHLGMIIGNIDIENIVDSIFSKFCVGK